MWPNKTHIEKERNSWDSKEEKKQDVCHLLHVSGELRGQGGSRDGPMEIRTSDRSCRDNSTSWEFPFEPFTNLSNWIHVYLQQEQTEDRINHMSLQPPKTHFHLPLKRKCPNQSGIGVTCSLSRVANPKFSSAWFYPGNSQMILIWAKLPLTLAFRRDPQQELYTL